MTDAVVATELHSGTVLHDPDNRDAWLWTDTPVDYSQVYGTNGGVDL